MRRSTSASRPRSARACRCRRRWSCAADRRRSGCATPSAPAIEDAFERGVVEAFEATGRLDVAFGELARHLESGRLARSRFWSKMLYPVFVLHAVILIPPVLVAFQEGAWAYVRAVAVPLAVVYGAFALFRWRPSLVRFLPVFGAAYRAQERARSLRAPAMLWEAGISVDRAMELAGMPAGSGTLTDRLAATGRFDATVLATAEVGETSGRVGESLKRAAVAIDLDATTRLDRAMKLPPVVAIVLLGAATAICLDRVHSGRLADNGAKIPPGTRMMDTTATDLYLDLMKKCLTDTLDNQDSLSVQMEVKPGPGRSLWSRIKNAAIRGLNKRGARLYRHDRQNRAWSREQIENGRVWPVRADTMVGYKRLDNVRMCIESVLRDNVPGDMIETGVWRGGTAIFMRAVLKAHGVTDRTIWAADSFQGLPSPSPEKYPVDAGDTHHQALELQVTLEQVKGNFAKYGLLDDRVRFLKGWFHETLPTAPIDKLAVLRLDGDMYESTIVALDALFHKLSVGGYAIVDDYEAVPGCKQAVTDFRAKHGITDEIHAVDWACIYWHKSC